MALSKDRLGELALIALQKKMEMDGIELKPAEVKRQIVNGAKTMGITPQEFAEFMVVVVSTAYDKCMRELDAFLK